ncbi:MAG: carboxypeptidase-like regulatory domain-containing protein, partial [Paludibacteraceae bacterium]|nr:carboxypeptidase-like regulatory domain-containing protein [Paludibacteraceae bacterium]
MKKIISILFALFSIAAYGLETKISGHVLNSVNNEHVPFISISLKGTTVGTVTDVSGHYTLQNSLLGEQILVVKGLGFIPVEKEITIEAGKPIEVNFEVLEDVVSLNDVVVSSNRNETTRKDASIVVGVINPKLFDATNSVCLAQGLSFQPGLRMESSCQNCGFQQVRINGLDGPYTQILIDSRPIFSALSGVYGIEQIPVNMIERVEVVRGGGSALYGSNAIAGTVNIITKEPISNSFTLKHNYELVGGNAPDNMFNANASIIADDRKSGMYLYGSYRNREYYDSDNDGYSEIPILKANSIGFNSFYKLSNYSKLNFEYHNLHEFRRGGNKFGFQPH